MESAMEAEKSRDFHALLKVSTRLHQLANMFVHLEHITSEEYRSTKLLDEQNIFFTDMNIDYIELYGGTDSQRSVHTVDNEFVWIGNNGRYAHVKQHQITGINHGSCVEWMKLDYSVSLKEFGSDQVSDVKLIFNSAPIKKTDKDDDDNEYYWANYVDNNLLEKISEWLNLSKPLDAARILFDAAEQCSRLGHEYSEEFISENTPTWNGRIAEELQRIVKKFLNLEEGWAKEIEFVSRRIVAKLRIMDMIKNAKELNDKARDELIGLIEHAGLKYAFMYDGVYNEPKVQQNLKGNPVKAILHQHSYELSFSKKEKLVATLLVRVQNVAATGGDIDCEDMFEEEDLATIEFPNGDGGTNPMQKFIEEFQLNHVTVEDLAIALEALKVHSEVPDKDSDAEDDCDSS
jgi:hypothetical protein